MVEDIILKTSLRDVKTLLQTISNEYSFVLASDEDGMIPVMVTFSEPEKYHSLKREDMIPWISRMERVVSSVGIACMKREGDFITGIISRDKIQNAVNELGKKYVLKLVNPGVFILDPGRMNNSTGNRKISDRSVRRA